MQLEPIYSTAPTGRELDPSDRWVRAYFNGQLAASSRKMLLLRKEGQMPTYLFPREDVQMELLQPSDHTDHWHLQVGSRIAEDAAYTHHDYISFKWEKIDHWFEEDEEILVHARDPYKRVDAIHSSRHLRIVLDGTTIAETRRPTLLFETGLPTRYYFPIHDTRMDLLEKTALITRCPYKGEANAYAINLEGTRYENLAWSYPFPVLACANIQGLIAFYNEKLDIYEDTTLLPRPQTPWT